MHLAKITPQGLRWIATLVMLLWACILLENITLKHAHHETARVLRSIRQMQNGKHLIPAAQPVQTHTARPVAS